jgi:hypothetical protein
MTTFTVVAIVRCSAEHCIHESREDFCKYVHIRGLKPGTRNYCNLFDKELVTVAGTLSPRRCSACLTAERQVKGKLA